MPRSPVRWTSDRRLTRVGARQAQGRPSPPVSRRFLTHAAHKSLFPAKCWCSSFMCRESLSRHLCSPPQPQLGTLPTSSYQQRACEVVASGDRDSRCPRSQVDRREVRPHICAPAHASLTALSHPPHPPPQNNQTSQVHVHRARGLPLLPSPRLDVSPIPSCPWLFLPQHFTLPSSCVEQQA